MIVFLGPSLPAAEARRIARCEVWPPARQGDIWRALERRPRAIALIDGVFESVPSVWHHEILDALDAGVPVFGGASMGALRAAELLDRGMVGVGRIFRWYRDGLLDGDADVALLHGDAGAGFRPLTVPHVNVVHAADEARRLRVLRPAEARALKEASAATFYQERTWPRVLAAARLAPPARERWKRFQVPDLKADDAREVLRAASKARGWQASPRQPGPSAHVRWRRIAAAAHLLRGRPDSDELTAQGLRRLLLAGWARELGLSASEAGRAEVERAWRARLGVRTRGQLAKKLKLDGAEVARACQDLALEELVLANAARMLNDGPSADEALVFEARLRGGTAEPRAGRTSRGTARRRRRR